MWRTATMAILASTLGLVLGGCGTESASGNGSGKPLVLTTFTVIADMVRQVGGDRIEVASITKPGAEVHGYEPTPGDLRRAAGADLVFDNGLGLERWFDQFIDRARVDRVSLTKGVDAIDITGDSDYAGKPNPHAWMSVNNADIYVDNIREALTKLDPDGADEYAANATAYKARLAKVRTYVETELAGLPASRRALVTCEGAFSYMARDFDLDEQYLWPVNAEQEGTPRQIADTVDFVREREVPSVFCESTVSHKAQKQVARTGAARP